MFYRKDAVLAAVAGLLASCGFAMAESPALSLSPVVKADAAADQAPLMWGLDKVGMAKPISDLGLNIYGWVEGGYTYNHRSHTGGTSNAPGILPGPFNHEVGNHFMMNQLDIRFERLVDSKKFDVGGMIEVMYGTDAGFTHSTGLPFNGNDPSDDNNPADAVSDKYRANYQFDLLQAYVDVNVPVGNGLKIRAGKFVTLLGYETIDPRANAFYSHSWIFSALPFTQTGVLGIYQINDQFALTAGFTRGWDQTLEDSGPAGGLCAIDFLGQLAWTPNKQLSAYLNLSVGPQNFNDTSHYRTVIDPIVSYQLTEQLKIAGELLYIYDGGLNGDGGSANPPTVTHAYGDVWGGAAYVQYLINDYVTANGRFEKFHSSGAGISSLNGLGTGSTNVYSATLGVTVTPLPKDPIGKNLSIRPEIRYDWSEDHIFNAGSGHTPFKDQLTFGADVIFKF